MNAKSQPSQSNASGAAVKANGATGVDATCAFQGPAARLVEILEQYLEQLKAGQAPSRQELLDRHPELAEQLDACLAGIEFIHRAEHAGSEAPRQLGDFRILREIGRGGMGAVYEAQQITLDRRVALKILRFGTISDPAAVDRFQREAETVARLHHTNIVPIFCVGQEKGVNFYAMQYIDGCSLADVLEKQKAPCDSQLVAQWGLQAAEALAHAHRRGVVHRDVKPSNLLLDREQRLWLTDFGLAKRLDDVTLSMTGALLGTPRYMSPEQASAAHRQVDARTDIYSLGATLYELATGEPVFAGTSPHDVIHQILSVDPRPPRQVCPAINRDFETILLRCLAKEPGQRYESATSLSSDLRALMENRPIQARRASLYERSVRWLRRQRRSVLAAGTAAAVTLVVALSALLGWWGYSRHQLGFLRLSTDEGPLAVEVYQSSDVAPLMRITAPTLDPLSISEGDYELHVSGEGRLSEKYRLYVDRGAHTEMHLEPDDAWLWTDLQVRLGYDIVRRPDGTHEIVSYTDEGIDFLGGRSRQRLWLLPLTSSPHPKLSPWTHLRWAEAAEYQYPDTADVKLSLRPQAMSQMQDLNGDGVADLVVTGGLQAWIVALSGRNGEPLWLVDRDPTLRTDAASQYERVAGRAAVPQWTSDINGDGVPEVLASFVAQGEARDPTMARRWLELFSGSSGESLWQFEFPQEYFNTAEAADALRWYTGQGGNGWSGGGGGMMSYSSIVVRDRGFVQPSGSYVFVQDACRQMQVRNAEGNGLVSAIAVIAGNQLLVLDPASGQPHQQAMPLGLPPGITARWGDLDGDQVDDVVLLAHATPANTATNRTGQHTLFAFSPTTGKVLWEKQTSSFWPGRHELALPLPPWPLVQDLNNDGRCEVIYLNGGSAGNPKGPYAELPSSQLEVCNGSDGRTLWHQIIRNMDQQVDCMIVGPDIDGDAYRDLFTASIWGLRYDLYIDALSGRNGEPLWHTQRALSRTRATLEQYHAGRITVEPTLGDGLGSLVVTLYHDSRKLPLTQIFAVRDGRWQSEALSAESQCVDMDGDGITEMLLARGESHNMFQPRQVSCRRGLIGERWRRLGEEWMPAADFDGDGHTDVVQIVQGQSLAAASLKSGDILWTTDLLHGGQSAQALVSPRRSGHASSPSDAAVMPGDLDNDGVVDVVTYFGYPHGFSYGIPLLQAISGRTGEKLWSSEAAANSIRSVGPVLPADDLDGDGTCELFCFASGSVGQIGANDDWMLYVLRGRDGAVRWQTRLTSPINPGARQHFELEAATYPFLLVDIDGDQLRDVIATVESEDEVGGWQLQALRSTDGEVLWQVPLAADQTPGYQFGNIAPLSAADVNADQIADVLLMEYTSDKGSGVDAAIQRDSITKVRITALSGVDGRLLWQYSEPVDNFVPVNSHDDFWSMSQRFGVTVLRSVEGPRLAINIVDRNSRLVVLDQSGNRLGSRPLSIAGRRSIRAFACDHDDNGQDELAIIEDFNLMIVDSAALDQPVWTTTVGHGLHVPPLIFDVWPSREHLPGMILLSQPLGETTVVAYAARDGRMLWNSPGRETFSIPSGGQPPLFVSPPADAGSSPLVLSMMAQSSGVREARWAEPTVSAAGSLFQKETYTVADPRFLRPLPWNFGGTLTLEIVNNFFWMMLHSAALVVIPVAYVTTMIWRRRWGLRWLLVLPLLLVIWIVAFTSQMSSIAPMANNGDKLFIAAVMAPCVFALAVLARWLAVGRWRRAAGWLSATLIAAVVVGLVTVLFVSPLQHAREAYSLEGAYWLWFPVAFVTSWILMLWVVISAVWQRFRRRNKSVAAA